MKSRTSSIDEAAPKEIRASPKGRKLSSSKNSSANSSQRSSQDFARRGHTIVPAPPSLVVPLQQLLIVESSNLLHDASIAQASRPDLKRVDCRQSLEEDMANRVSTRINERESNSRTGFVDSDEGAERQVDPDDAFAVRVAQVTELASSKCS